MFLVPRRNSFRVERFGHRRRAPPFDSNASTDRGRSYHHEELGVFSLHAAGALPSSSLPPDRRPVTPRTLSPDLTTARVLTPSHEVSGHEVPGPGITATHPSLWRSKLALFSDTPYPLPAQISQHYRGAVPRGGGLTLSSPP